MKETNKEIQIKNLLYKDDNYNMLLKKKKRKNIRQKIISIIFVISLSLIAFLILYWLVIILPPTNLPTGIYACLVLGTPIIIGLIGIPLLPVTLNLFGCAIHSIRILDNDIHIYEIEIKLKVSGFKEKDCNVARYDMLSEELREFVFDSEFYWEQYLQNKKK